MYPKENRGVLSDGQKKKKCEIAEWATTPDDEEVAASFATQLRNYLENPVQKSRGGWPNAVTLRLCRHTGSNWGMKWAW